MFQTTAIRSKAFMWMWCQRVPENNKSDAASGFAHLLPNLQLSSWRAINLCRLTTCGHGLRTGRRRPQRRGAAIPNDPIPVKWQCDLDSGAVLPLGPQSIYELPLAITAAKRLSISSGETSSL